MTTAKIRIVLIAAALSAGAAWLGACAGQPAPGCVVATAYPLVVLPPYWVKYTKVSSTGACGDLAGEGIGFQKYPIAGSKESRLAYTITGLGLPYFNGRVDPADPEGKNINGFARLPAKPNPASYCPASEFTAASQNFELIPDEPGALADGGTKAGEPALSRRYEFTRLEFLETTNAPGTVFTGELKLTEDGCSAVFSTFGVWPALNPLSLLGCDPASNDPGRNGYNPQCDPNIVTLENYPDLLADGGLPDGGVPETTQFGSGLNPSFQTKEKPITCGEKPDVEGIHHCEVQLTLEEISRL